MSIKSLAEGIILQSLEDLWDTKLSNGSIDFFKGGDFRACAEMAGMSLLEQVKLLNMVKDVVDYHTGKVPLQPPVFRQAYRGIGGYRRELPCQAR